MSNITVTPAILKEWQRRSRIAFFVGSVACALSLSWTMGQLYFDDGFYWVNALAAAGYALVLLFHTKGHRRIAQHLLQIALILHVVVASVVGDGIHIGAQYWCLVFACYPFLFFSYDSRRWCGVYAAVSIAALVMIEMSIFGPASPAPEKMRLVLEATRPLNLISIGLCLFMVVNRFVGDSVRAERANESLLENIFPAHIVDRLRTTKGTIADSVDDATVLFADLVGFTPLASSMPATELVQLLDSIFSSFDELADEYRVEKVKTIGDAYMAVCFPTEDRNARDAAGAVVSMAKKMQEVVAKLDVHSQVDCPPLRIRIGIHQGPLVAGVIGTRRFAYDIWGDTVNTAARLESHGEPDEIHISPIIRGHLGEEFELVSRGLTELKGKDPMETYFVR